MIFFTLITVVIFLSKSFFKLSWIWFFGQSYVFRIQQLKQLLEDSTSDDDGSSSSSSEDKEKHKKKKEKHKKKKKEKKKKKQRKHKSSKSNESSDSEWREPGLFNILFSKTKHCGQRWEDPWREVGSERNRRERRPEGRRVVSPVQVLTCLPGRMRVVCLQVLALDTPDFRLDSFPPCAPPCWSPWVPTL